MTPVFSGYLLVSGTRRGAALVRTYGFTLRRTGRGAGCQPWARVSCVRFGFQSTRLRVPESHHGPNYGKEGNELLPKVSSTTSTTSTSLSGTLVQSTDYRARYDTRYGCMILITYLHLLGQTSFLLITILTINYLLILIFIIQGGVPRGGLAPALAPRMSVITEDAGKSRPKVRHNSTAKGYLKKKSRLNEEKENSGIRFNEPGTNCAIQHTLPNSSRTQQHCFCSNNSSSIATHRVAAAAAYTTDLSIAQTTPQSSHISLYCQRKNGKNGTHRKAKIKPTSGI